MDYSKYDTMELQELVETMSDIKIKLDEADEKKKELQKIYDHLRLNKIPEMMDDEGINTVTYEGIGRVSLTSDIYASILKDNKDAAWEWLRENNMGAIITEYIHPGTLKATLKDLLKKGMEFPTDIFSVTPFSRASITRIKR